MGGFSVRPVLYFVYLCLVVSQTNAQSLTTTLPTNEFPSTLTAPPVCGDCHVVAAYTVTTVSPTKTTDGIGSFTFDISGFVTPGASASGRVFAVFSAYSVTSAFTSNGTCSTIAGPPIPVVSGSFSASLPDGPNSGSVQALQAAEESFMSYLGLISCSAGGDVQVPLTHVPPSIMPDSSSVVTLPPTITAVWTGNVTSSSMSNLSSLSSSIPQTTMSTVPSPRPHGTSFSVGMKTAIGVAVPVGSILLLIFGGLLLRRFRKRREGSEKQSIFPFFQQKPELSGEDSRYEMLVERKTPEMSGDAMVYEMPPGKRRQELEGDNGTREIAASR